MACYISSNQNRLYAALEESFGAVASITAADRIPAVKLGLQHETIQARRRDKTGSRTQAAIPAGSRTRTRFQLETYLSNWANTEVEPAQGALVRAALGAAPLIGAGGVVASTSGSTTLTMSGAHGLSPGQAVSFGSELRFVAEVLNATTFRLNAPFSILPGTGAPLNPTITYSPATQLPTVSLFDYWSPATAVQRIAAGAAIERLRVNVNADYHEMAFDGEARELVDNVSFSDGFGELSAFPPEPALAGLEYQVIPGHLGQVWMGLAPTQIFTLVEAQVEVKNNLDLRKREFGFDGPKCVAAGQREVGIRFRIYEQDDAATLGLWTAARARQPVPVMLQLGQEPGQLCGIYLPNVVPEVPEFDDRQPRLEWSFSLSQAQGSIDDEIRIAFA